MSLGGVFAPSLRAAGQMIGARGCLFTFHRAARKLQWETLPNRDFYLNLDFLEDLLEYLLRQNWDIVTLHEARRRIGHNGIDRKFVNFSIDDCYRDTFEDVVPLFRKYRVPVSLFVTTGIPDGTMTLKHVGLEDILHHHKSVVIEGETIEIATPETKREAFLRFAGKLDEAGGEAFYARICEQNGVSERDIHWRNAISWDMLNEIKSDRCVEIGAHTISHPHVSALSPDQARAEMLGSRQRLEEKLEIPVKHFAYPYGRVGDCLAGDSPLAQSLGFETISTTIKGLLRQGANPLFLPRNTLNGSHQSIALVETHLVGLAAIAAKVLGRV